MATGDENFKKYGVPLVNAAWVPLRAFKLLDTGNNNDNEKGKGGEGSTSSSSNNNNNAVPPAAKDTLILAGVGGKGKSGIPNSVLITEFDRSSVSLPDEPVIRHGMENDAPYRMAVHPLGEGFICSFSDSCRWFDWERRENNGLGFRPSDRVLTQLENIGQQQAITFSLDGSLLALGGDGLQDGRLRILKWPSMEIIVDEGQAYTKVKDLHFSIDGRYLACVGEGGPCRVWDVTKPKLSKPFPISNDEEFSFCRFSQRSDGSPALYILSMEGNHAKISSWQVGSWRMNCIKLIVRQVASSFDASINGNLLAIGTVKGNILIIDASNLRVQMTVKKAHRGFVTALAFSRDSRVLGSASMDSSVRVSLIQDKSSNGFNNWIAHNWSSNFNVWIAVLIAIIAVAAYLLRFFIGA